MTKPVDHKQFYRTPWGMAFIAYLMAMGLVGALTPPDILTAYSWTRPFTDFMASLVSQIDKVTALGIDEDINRFYFSVMWACSPMLVLMYVLFILDDKRRKIDSLAYYRKDKSKAVKAVFVLLILGLISYHVEWLTFARSRIVLGSFGTNFGRFFSPQVFVVTPVICAFPAITLVVIDLTDRIKRNIK